MPVSGPQMSLNLLGVLGPVSYERVVINIYEDVATARKAICLDKGGIADSPNDDDEFVDTHLIEPPTRARAKDERGNRLFLFISASHSGTGHCR